MTDLIGSILGAGPSLEMPENDSPAIALNRLIETESLRTHSQVFFLAADILLAEDLTWVRSSLEVVDRLYLGRELRELLLRNGHQGFARCHSPEEDGASIFDTFRSRFPMPNFPLMNVALDFAIPLAVSLGWRKIRLSGCDFNYGSLPQSPIYSDSVRSAGDSFRHDQSTMATWSLFSENRLREIISWGEVLGVEISRQR